MIPAVQSTAIVAQTCLRYAILPKVGIKLSIDVYIRLLCNSKTSHFIRMVCGASLIVLLVFAI